MDLSASRWAAFGICAALAMMTWLVYGQTLKHEFVNYDDNHYVYENPVVQHGLTIHGTMAAFSSTDLSLWTPLTRISHMVATQFFKLRPGGHHFINVLLHSTNAILLFLLLRKMTNAFWPSAFVAALFAIHPLHVESVAWVSERKDVLSGLFFILTLWAYYHYAQYRQSLLRYSTVCILFVCGLMAKPMLITLPFVSLLLDYWSLQRLVGSAEGITRLFPRRVVLEKIPLIILAGLFVSVVLLDPFSWNPPRPGFVPYPLYLRLTNAVISYATYCWQMIWPVDLTVRYPFPSHFEPAKVVSSLVFLCGITLWAFSSRRNMPYALVGWLWYLGMLVPVIGVVELGGEAHADRYTYLPQIGLYILIAWTVSEFITKRPRLRNVGTIAAVAVVCGFAYAARIQAAYWRDSESLWTRAVAVTRDNDVAHAHLGTDLAIKGRLAEAIVHLQRALEINPTNEDAHRTIGIAYAQQGRTDEAINHFQAAIQLNPNHPAAHNNLGNAYLQKGELDLATTEFQRAIQLDPHHRTAYSNLGSVFSQRGDFEQAIAYYRKQLKINPDYVDVYFSLANILVKVGKTDDAIAHYRKVLQLHPNYPGAEEALEKIRPTNE